ncbi:MAG: helix-hairpin-helix domain-containing protein [Chloroflexi bacterium]|nr:helix-hairpin-helix domain-containing protein [Chloroflexota bacterium]
MKVRILKAGIYNGPGHKALPWAEEGDVITVATALYANSLMADGLVAPYVPPTAEGDGDQADDEQEAAGGDDDQEEETGPDGDQAAAGKALADLPGIGPEIADILIRAGYDTVAKVRAASDQDLLAISGIQKKRLAGIRKALKEDSSQ